MDARRPVTTENKRRDEDEEAWLGSWSNSRRTYMWKKHSEAPLRRRSADWMMEQCQRILGVQSASSPVNRRAGSRDESVGDKSGSNESETKGGGE
ncbi:hypothetical protein Y032_0234g3159 [Ancylostoma ceylanicum]|uniref:Uncharacterized protein n=1 Tax=Ancylostoma ceylanicum TaxID=53326 RepID=A0A016SFY6_9BILA|nr:hypothetical protein Y032_0234g3159 [Ancylostoma ceylanicum]